jgi:hypothetical protein
VQQLAYISRTLVEDHMRVRVDGYRASVASLQDRLGVLPRCEFVARVNVTKDHADGERIRPTVWPTPTLNEGDDLAFDILAVASPYAGSDLTVVIQT